MAEETRTAGTVAELIAAPQWDANTLLALRTAVRNSIQERDEAEELYEDIDKAGLSRDARALREAALCWVLGETEQAEAALKNVAAPLDAVIRGALAAEKGRYEEAVQQFQTARAAAPQSVKLAAELAGALRAAGKVDEAVSVLDSTGEAGQKDADVLVQRGWCLEAYGRQQAAAETYERALAADSKHALAAFRYAYLLDLRGEDQKAIDMYRRVAGQGSAFVNAMINLGLLLEDSDDVDGAISCFKEALKADPANRRANLYLRDAVESLDMYYDEAQRKEDDRLANILRIPVNEFELSVRSRNCLAKMNVRTLGDLVRKTEAELMAYKNFGETSLREIRQLLESKGLRLGMHKEEEAKRARAQRIRLGATQPENSTQSKPITDLELSVRSRKCMQRLNIETIGDLCDKSEADLLATKNFGQTSLNEVKSKLAEMGLSLKASD